MLSAALELTIELALDICLPCECLQGGGFNWYYFFGGLCTMFRLRSLLAAVAGLLVGGAIFGMPTSANASFTLTLTETGGPSITITDNQVGPPADANPAVGTITVVALTVGDFTVSVQTSISNAAQGVLPATVTTNVTAFNNDAGQSHILTIVSSDTGFTVPASSTKVAMSTNLADSSPLSVSGLSDTFFSTLGVTNGTLLTVTSPTAHSGPVSDVETIPSNPYTLSNTLAITVVGAAPVGGLGNANGEVQAQGTTQVTPVPVPAGVFLVLSAVPALGFSRLLKRRQAVVAA
jgi:hypothetical protein